MVFKYRTYTLSNEGQCPGYWWREDNKAHFKVKSWHLSRGTEDVSRNPASNMADIRSSLSDTQKSAEK
jgi:hypothetical protein